MVGLGLEVHLKRARLPGQRNSYPYDRGIATLTQNANIHTNNNIAPPNAEYTNVHCKYYFGGPYHSIP